MIIPNTTPAQHAGMETVLAGLVHDVRGTLPGVVANRFHTAGRRCAGPTPPLSRRDTLSRAGIAFNAFALAAM